MVANFLVYRKMKANHSQAVRDAIGVLEILNYDCVSKATGVGLVSKTVRPIF